MGRKPSIGDLERVVASDEGRTRGNWRWPFVLSDDAAWEAFVEQQLTDEDLSYLWEAFQDSPVADIVLDDDPQRIEDLVFRGFCVRVWRLKVEIRAAGRTVVRDPTENHRVEMQWLYQKRKKIYRVKRMCVIGDAFLSLDQLPDEYEYLTAFYLRHRQLDPAGTYGRPPVARPAPGQPLNADFYQRLLIAYDKLVAEGRPRPALELAERMDVNHSTLKSWLSRGRAYLKEERHGLD